MSAQPPSPSPAVPGDDIADWLTLARTPGLGGRRLTKLLDHFGSPGAILGAGRQQLQPFGLPGPTLDALQAPDLARIEQDRDWLARPGNHFLRRTDAAYPARLAEIPDAPPFLFVHGDIDYLNQPQLAVVGSRNPSRTGLGLAEDFAAFLGGCGLTICSGLATGIDAAAHRGALRTAAGTVAVTGTGLDRVYPSQHRDLAHQIAANGALVSEFPPGTPPLPANFPRRNRIISGLSLGTLVVEAAVRSGSLITARLALEQGREVFAIPGSIHNPLARGCHALIRQGAKLVECGEDILEELGAQIGALTGQPANRPADAPAQGAPTLPAELGEDYQRLLDAMGFEPVAVDQLVTRSGLTPEEVSSMLLLLELEDRVHPGAGGRYTRTS